MMKKILLLGLSVTMLGACGTQQPATYNYYGVQKGPGSSGVHVVAEGDTLYTISKNYQIPMRDIIALNKLKPPYVLNVGYRMKLPPPNEYRVRIGDSLQSIAALYEVSPAKLEKLNGLKEPYYLTPGQILRLPTSYQKNVVGVPRNVSGQRSAVATTRGISPQPVEREALAPLPTKKSVAAVPKRSIPKNVVSNIKPEIPKPQVKTASVPKAKTPSIPKLAAGNFMRPVDGKIVSSFGTKKDGLHNDGINIKAVKGTPVRAAQNGVVVYNGDDLEGYGNLVLIRHENKMVTAYAHLDKTLVKRGAKVSRGQSIGTVGKTGQVDTPQLHFEIRKGSTPLNPDKFL